MVNTKKYKTYTQKFGQIPQVNAGFINNSILESGQNNMVYDMNGTVTMLHIVQRKRDAFHDFSQVVMV